MGLNIIARFRSNSELEIENTYKLENWHKVETGEITETEYNNNFPNFKPRWINVSEFGIRNFWGLKKFFKEELHLDGEDVFYLNKEAIFYTLMNAEDHDIPCLDTFNYLEKCDEVARVCRKALMECDFNTEKLNSFLILSK